MKLPMTPAEKALIEAAIGEYSKRLAARKTPVSMDVDGKWWRAMGDWHDASRVYDKAVRAVVKERRGK